MRIRCLEVATGRYRSPDPWLSMRDTILVRRLSPTNSKLEIDSHGKRTPTGRESGGEVTGDILRLMGSDLAAVHLGTGNNRKAIKSDLRDRGKIDCSWGRRGRREFIESEQGNGKRPIEKPIRKRKAEEARTDGQRRKTVAVPDQSLDVAQGVRRRIGFPHDAVPKKADR